MLNYEQLVLLELVPGEQGTVIRSDLSSLRSWGGSSSGDHYIIQGEGSKTRLKVYVCLSRPIFNEFSFGKSLLAVT